MCRHAAYIGPGISLAELTLELDHGLLAQSYQARELLTGVVCGDGFGVAWYDPDERPEPARFVDPGPIWADPNLESMAGVIRSGCVVAAIRNATVAGENCHANCAPFVHGRWSWSFNGHLEDFRDAWREALTETLVPPDRQKNIRGSTDGEWLFHAFLHRLATDPGATAAASLQAVLREVRDLARNLGKEAHLNVLASDGEQILATRAGTMEKQNSLYHLQDGDEFPGGHVIASEPLYDDPLWETVPQDTVMAVLAEAPPVRLRA